MLPLMRGIIIFSFHVAGTGTYSRVFRLRNKTAIVCKYLLISLLHMNIFGSKCYYCHTVSVQNMDVLFLCVNCVTMNKNTYI